MNITGHPDPTRDRSDDPEEIGRWWSPDLIPDRRGITLFRLRLPLDITMNGTVPMITPVTILALIFATLPDPPDRKEPPSKEVLAAITQRGRDLAGYDDAAWHASDAVRAKNPKPGSVAGYIARKTDKGWVVAFGRLDECKAKYLIAYEAARGDGPDGFAVEAFDPPKPDTGFFRAGPTARPGTSGRPTTS
jgi:hypothetical protein